MYKCDVCGKPLDINELQYVSCGKLTGPVEENKFLKVCHKCMGAIESYVRVIKETNSDDEKIVPVRFDYEADSKE